VVLLGAILFSAAPPRAASAASAAGDKTTASPEVRALMTSFAEEWLKEQGVKSPAAAPPVKRPEDSVDYLNTGAAAIHDQILELARAIPGLPHEFARAAARITAVDPDAGRGQVFLDLGIFGDPYYVATRRLAAEAQALLDLVIFGACSLAAIWLFRRITGRARRGLLGLPMETVKDRLRVIAARFALAFGVIAAFLLGTFGPLFARHWDPTRREIVLAFLTILVVIWAAVATGDLLLAPNDERYRVVPTETAARFWCRRLTVLAGWFAFVSVIIQECSALYFSSDGVQVVAYTFGLGLLAIALEAVWRRPIAPRRVAEAASPDMRRFGRGATNITLSIGIVLLWALWIASPGVWTVEPGFWLVFVLIILPPAISASRRAIEHLLRPPGSFPTGGPPSVIEATLEHGIRALLIIGSAAGARLHSLLPIFRNVLFVLVIAVAAMMALAELGVEIGPLIAGASVVGVAIGFGAQTFVRDVIAGMFYLLDDAFRVGEYIQSGNYKGTVEGFSIRSVRLRHHRGPVYTVPFSLLGANQNQSRDWVIDKIAVGVTYDSDLEKARKLIKQIGLDLQKDPEFAPLILEPLKMQGVEQLGDFAVQIRAKMMTLPGEQLVIRRKAYAMIKKAFDENGIKFAFPTVQVAGESEAANAAVAQHALELTRPAAA
jgi:moderate conductance mechanosensitive channel